MIVAFQFRGRGYGRAGLELLCEAARANGVEVLRDNIAVGNPAADMFIKAGFTEEFRTNEIIMLKKTLQHEPPQGEQHHS